MATQQGAPSRPWLRLATMARPPPSALAPPPPPEQTPAPPRPAFIRPAFQAPLPAPPPQPPATNGTPPISSPTQRQPLVAKATPSPPTQPQRQSGPPSPVATSPPPQARSLSFTATMAPTPTPSPQKTLEQHSPPSPTINSISRPPSPLALPSPQLKSYHPEYEQKSVLVQETIEKPKSLDNGFTRHTSWGPNNPKKDTSKIPETFKKHLDSEDSGMRIITIGGENKGAIMDLTQFWGKTHNFGNNPHSLHNNKDNPTASSDGEKSESSSDGKSKAKNKNKNSKSSLVSAVMNSNVQGVNNSILFNSSATHHDPGVHLSLSRKPTGSRQLNSRTT